MFWKANMLYFLWPKNEDPGLCQHSVPIQSFQNGQTLEQFFEPLWIQDCKTNPWCTAWMDVWAWVLWTLSGAGCNIFLYWKASCPIILQIDARESFAWPLQSSNSCCKSHAKGSWWADLIRSVDGSAIAECSSQDIEAVTTPGIGATTAINPIPMNPAPTAVTTNLAPDIDYFLDWGNATLGTQSICKLCKYIFCLLFPSSKSFNDRPTFQTRQSGKTIHTSSWEVNAWVACLKQLQLGCASISWRSMSQNIPRPAAILVGSCLEILILMPLHCQPMVRSMSPSLPKHSSGISLILLLLMTK